MKLEKKNLILQIISNKKIVIKRIRTKSKEKKLKNCLEDLEGQMLKSRRREKKK